MKIDWEDVWEGVSDNFGWKVFGLLFLFCAVTGAYYWFYRLLPYLKYLLNFIYYETL